MRTAAIIDAADLILVLYHNRIPAVGGCCHSTIGYERPNHGKECRRRMRCIVYDSISLSSYENTAVVWRTCDLRSINLSSRTLTDLVPNCCYWSKKKTQLALRVGIFMCFVGVPKLETEIGTVCKSLHRSSRRLLLCMAEDRHTSKLVI